MSIITKILNIKTMKELIEVSEQDIKDLKTIKNYFGEHDKSLFEHHAFSFLDKMIKSIKAESLQPKGKTKEELSQLFKKNSDCYADTWEFDEMGTPFGGEVIQAITEGKFIEVMQSHANQDGWVSCADKKADVINIDGEWIEFEGAPNLFTEMANKNCMCRFDDGTECRYMDEHPQAVMTHFQITP